MTLRRLFLVTVALTGLFAASFVAKETESPGVRMTSAAEQWLATLKPDQKTKATYEFGSPERTNWYFVPRQDKEKRPTRKGLPMEEMSAEQKEAARGLVAAGTSAAGFKKATTIMSLEAILRDLEKGGAMVRNPDWYFFTVFGAPSKTGRWGWRVEGHHLSLNFTIDAGLVVSATPAFFGANPAEIKSGPKAGFRTLPEAEEHARALFASLDEQQLALARQPKQFPEIQEAKPVAEVEAPVGLPVSKMTEEQRALLQKLVTGYAVRMPPAVASEQLTRIKEAGLDKVHFAYAVEDSPGKPHTYRVQGPTFVIMFLNVQKDSAGNPANHIHSVWRNLPGDFGLGARQ
jgi:hypothetical protein